MADILERLRNRIHDCPIPAEHLQDDAADEIERLRDAIRPFAEIACRLGWDKIPDDSMELNDHVMEAPAEDTAPGAAYCLVVGAFRDAAKTMDVVKVK